MSIREDVGNALKVRLESITSGNGYPISVRAVYYDKIPMGLELGPEDMPALFLLDDGATIEHLHQALEISRAFRVQIVDQEAATDGDLNTMIRLIAKAVWANHPNAAIQDAYRFHERVYWVQMDSDETDLHMIEGNRIATVRMIVHYRTRPYDL